MRVLLARLFVVLGLVAPAGLVAAGPAAASSTDCLSYAYACTPGYTGSNASGTWAWTHYGASYASTPNGIHNCTLYAAWRLEENGLTRDPGNWGNATNWAQAIGGGNHTPAVGSIAWYGGTTANKFGHVAYVEEVSGGNVYIRADNYSTTRGYTDAGWVAASSVGLFLHPHDIAGGATTGLRSMRTSDGHIQLFQIAGGVVKQNWYSPSNGAIGGWTQSPGLAAQAVGTPAVVARAGQSVIDIFVRAGNGSVYETWYNWGSGAWGGWIGLGGSVTSDPQAVATSDGHDQVFATGSNLVRQSWFSPGNGTVGGWVTSAGLGAGATGTPALVARAGQPVIDAFVRGGNGSVYETWYNWGTGAWGGWIGLGGAVSSDPQAVATSDGHDQVFATGGNLVRQSWFSPGNGTVGGWVTSAGLGAGATGTPALVARTGQPVIDAFVRGGNGSVYETWYNWGTGAWGGWIGLGGSVTSDPQAVATSDGHDQVFATGSNLVRQNWFSPGNGTIGGWISF